MRRNLPDLSGLTFPLAALAMKTWIINPFLAEFASAQALVFIT